MKMRAYIINTRKIIEPFGEHPRDCLISNKTLREIQESLIRTFNIDLIEVEEESQIHDSEEHLILIDSLYFNKKLLEEFISRSRELKKNTVCAVKPGIFTLRSIISTQDVIKHNDRIEYNLRYVTPLGQKGDTVPVVFNADKYHENLSMPEHMLGTPGYKIPLPEKLVIQIDHWANLWSANIGALLESVGTVLDTPKWKLLATALKAGSTNKWKIASKLNNIGRNCDIHPNAYIEGSIIGNNVKVGAGSVIRESNIANNATIENGVTLNFSIVGEGSYIADGTVIRYSTIYPNTFIGFSTSSAQVFGRNCFVGDGVTLTDYRLDGKNITILKNGKVVDTGNKLLGSCIGHDTYLAAGTIVAPGRAIPNGTRIMPENCRIIQKINPNGTIPDYQQVNEKTRKESDTA